MTLSRRALLAGLAGACGLLVLPHDPKRVYSFGRPEGLIPGPTYILVMDQKDSSKNGVYRVEAGAWPRHSLIWRSGHVRTVGRIEIDQIVRGQVPS